MKAQTSLNVERSTRWTMWPTTTRTTHPEAARWATSCWMAAMSLHVLRAVFRSTLTLEVEADDLQVDVPLGFDAVGQPSVRQLVPQRGHDDREVLGAPGDEVSIADVQGQDRPPGPRRGAGCRSLSIMAAAVGRSTPKPRMAAAYSGGCAVWQHLSEQCKIKGAMAGQEDIDTMSRFGLNRSITWAAQVVTYESDYLHRDRLE